MQKTAHYSKDLLMKVLHSRADQDPSYSLRRFAGDLGISVQQLSGFLNGKKGFSLKAAESISDRLKLKPAEKEMFCAHIQARFSRSPVLKTIAKKRVQKLSSNSWQKSELSIEVFEVIANWYHYGLIELIKINEGRYLAPEFLAKKLSISQNEVSAALQRLKNLNLIRTNGKGYLFVNQKVVVSSEDIPSEALRKFHAQILQKAVTAISSQSPDERMLSSTLLPMKMSQIGIAKKLILDFRDQFASEMAADDSTEVYALSIQFFNAMK
jgi:uncharacterized protein (TIGR02147 family)